MKEIRKDLIKSKLADIIDSVNVVGENLSVSFKDFVNMGLIKEGIYKKTEFAIESILDICNIINSDLNLGVPGDDEGIIYHLETKEIFSKKVISLIRDIKKFRNILVHKYGDIDDKMAFESIKDGLKDFELIINEIEKFLKKNE